jgi:hypothetical protein
MHLRAQKQSEGEYYKNSNFASEYEDYSLNQGSFDTFYDDYIQSQMGSLFKDDKEVKRILQSNPALVKKIIDRKGDIDTYLSHKTIDYLTDFRPPFSC